MRTIEEVKTYVHNGLLNDGMVKTVGAYAFAVYVIICEHANWETGESYVGFETIIERTGFAVNTIRKSVDRLQQQGYIRVEFRRKETRSGRQYGRKQHIYTATLPANAPYSHSKIKKQKGLYYSSRLREKHSGSRDDP